jgi:hypothetical protein
VVVERSAVISVTPSTGSSHPSGSAGTPTNGLEWEYAWLGGILVLAGSLAAGVIWSRRRVRGRR